MVDRRFALRSMIFITDLKIDFFVKFYASSPPPRQHLHKKQFPIEPTLSMTQPIHGFHVDRWGMMPTSI